MLNNIYIKPNNRLIIIAKKIRNRIPESLLEVCQKKLLPYLAILMIAFFTVIADVAKAAEIKSEFMPSDEVMDLSPAEVAKVVSVVGPYTERIEEDPLTVALAIEDKNYLGKPILAETEITEQPKSEVKRAKTIVYTVEDGDTISKIGWEYGLKVATIKATNNLSSDTIRLGQQIKLPPQDLDPQTIANLSVKRVAGASQPAQAFKGTFRSPTSGWRLTQTFGRTDFERWHSGIDLDWGSGTTIFASASGKVIRVSRGWGGGYGNHIIIDHGSGFQTLYGHLAGFSVSSGQWVNQGQVIGKMGSTGWSTGVHLHFEIRKNGTAVNPLNYL